MRQQGRENKNHILYNQAAYLPGGLLYRRGYTQNYLSSRVKSCRSHLGLRLPSTGAWRECHRSNFRLDRQTTPSCRTVPSALPSSPLPEGGWGLSVGVVCVCVCAVQPLYLTMVGGAEGVGFAMCYFVLARFFSMLGCFERCSIHTSFSYF